MFHARTEIIYSLYLVNSIYISLPFYYLFDSLNKANRLSVNVEEDNCNVS